MYIGWSFISIFILFLIILGIIHLASLISGSRGKEPHGESALHILKARYAKGEITKGRLRKDEGKRFLQEIDYAGSLHFPRTTLLNLLGSANGPVVKVNSKKGGLG